MSEALCGAPGRQEQSGRRLRRVEREVWREAREQYAGVPWFALDGVFRPRGLRLSTLPPPSYHPFNSFHSVNSSGLCAVWSARRPFVLVGGGGESPIRGVLFTFVALGSDIFFVGEVAPMFDSSTGCGERSPAWRPGLSFPCVWRQ